jgi:hypothetical protein
MLRGDAYQLLHAFVSLALALAEWVHPLHVQTLSGSHH